MTVYKNALIKAQRDEGHRNLFGMAFIFQTYGSARYGRETTDVEAVPRLPSASSMTLLHGYAGRKAAREVFCT